MMPRHARIVDAFESDVQSYIRWYSGLERSCERRSQPLSHQLAQAGLTQPDVVLALMRGGFIEQAERLVGRRITRCPPCLRPHWAPLSSPDEVEPDQRRVKVIATNPRLPSTHAHYRFNIFREGMTVTSFLTRGGTRRDVREAVKRGWIQLEDRA